MKVLKENPYLRYSMIATLLFGCVVATLAFVSSYQNNTSHKSLKNELSDLNIIRSLTQALQQEGQFTSIGKESFNSGIKALKGDYQALSEAKNIFASKAVSTIVSKSVLSEIRNELVSLRKTLEERSYRQRHQVKDFISTLDSNFTRVVQTNDTKFLSTFEKDLSTFLRNALDRPIIPEYKERMIVHVEKTMDLIGSMDHREKILLDTKEKAIVLRDLLNVENSILQTVIEVTDKKASIISMSSAINFFQGLFFLSFIMTGIVYGTQKTGRMFVGYSRLKKKFKSDLKIASRQRRISQVLASSELDYRAIVKKNGKILWATEGFKKLFASDEVMKKGWNNILKNKMISIGDVTGIEKSYKLLIGTKKDVIVDVEDFNSFQDIKLVSIQPVVEYYADFIKSESINKNTIPQYCIVDEVIDKVLISRAEDVSLLDLLLESNHELPRVFKDAEELVASALNKLVDMLTSAKTEKMLIGKPVLSYQTNKAQVVMCIDLKKTILTQSKLSQPLKIGAFKYEGIAHYFKKLEEDFIDNDCSVLIKNISLESSDGVLEKYSRIEISLSPSQASNHTKNTQKKSLIRSSSIVQTVDM